MYLDTTVIGVGNGGQGGARLAPTYQSRGAPPPLGEPFIKT